MSDTSSEPQSDPTETPTPVAKPGEHAEPKGSFEKGMVEESCWF